MKKIITLIAVAAAMLAVSCQKETPATDNTGSSSTPGKLIATIAQTKVTYAETSEMNLQPSWEIGDKIMGFDDSWKSYTLTVESVDAETATLSGSVPDGALHLIYKSDSPSFSDSGTKTLTFNYVNQKGDKTMPAVMLADGIVKDGGCNFTFTNAGAIIGISAVKGVPSGSAISKITIEGENLSGATVSLDGGSLKLAAKTNASDAISTAALSGISVTDANGTLSKPVFIAIPAGAVIEKVSAIVTKEAETMKIPSTAADKKDIDYVEIAAKYDGTNVTTKKWAKWNVGANKEKDNGWYFAWAGTEGYVNIYSSVLRDYQWVSASGAQTYSYSLSSHVSANPGDYLYVKTQSFITAGHNFGWAYTPYHTGTNSSTGWIKYVTVSSYWSGEGSRDNKTVLDLEDDAAHVNWGGTWRMPTSAELNAMKDATYWAWDSTDNGFYVFAPDDSHTAGTVISSIPDDLSKGSALLLFPAASYGDGNRFITSPTGGYYWSSTLYSPPYIAYSLKFIINSSSCSVAKHGDFRSYGCSVRPISD